MTTPDPARDLAEWPIRLVVCPNLPSDVLVFMPPPRLVNIAYRDGFIFSEWAVPNIEQCAVMKVTLD